MTLRIALAGNPNAGKTTVFNSLTGSRQRVANYPGITVECKEGTLQQDGNELLLVDLPGCYSLTAYSEEELVARRYLAEARPGVVIDVVAAPSLERNLYLAVQFLELGIPTVLALNMMDELKSQNVVIDTERLSSLLGIPVVGTVARTDTGVKRLLAEAVRFAKERNGEWKPLRISYGPDLDAAMVWMCAKIEAAGFLAERYQPRWVALKYLENDEEILAHGLASGEALHEELRAKVLAVRAHCRKTLDTTPEALIADFRYGFIASIMKEGVVRRDTHRERILFSDRMDRLLTHPALGPGIMFSVLYAIFYVTFTFGEIPMGWVESIFEWMGDTVTAVLPEGALQSLLVSGVIDGVGGVLGFVPIILIMFMLVSVLEDSGYMARVAYMLDRVFRLFGLHGCSVMPFIISGGIAGGCAVPGVMAARTLRSPKEKLATILTAPFMVCGAKIPMFIVIIAAFFPGQKALAMFCVTMGGWVAALLVAKFLRSTLIRGESTPFLMELPPYRLPTLRGVMIHSWNRTWMYIKKAGTVILAISVFLWAAMTYPSLPEQQVKQFAVERTTVQASLAQSTSAVETDTLQASLADIGQREGTAALKHSFAGRFGVALEPVSVVAGFDWRTNIALIGGFAAKEVIVSTLATAYSLGGGEEEEGRALSQRIADDPHWTYATALSLMVFVLLYSPCLVAVVAVAKESKWRWALFGSAFSTALAFGVATAVYQITRALL